MSPPRCNRLGIRLEPQYCSHAKYIWLLLCLKICTLASEQVRFRIVLHYQREARGSSVQRLHAGWSEPQLTFTSTLAPNATSNLHSVHSFNSCTRGTATGSTGADICRPGKDIVGATSNNGEGRFSLVRQKIPGHCKVLRTLPGVPGYVP